MNLPILSSSRLRDARRCLRLHKLRYLDGYRPARESDELRFGSLFHVGMEAWWRAASGRLDAALTALRAEPDVNAFDLAKAEVLLIGYDTRWGEDRYEVLGVEQRFESALVNPDTGKDSKTWRIAGRVDAVVRDDRGRVLVIEHKTTSESIDYGGTYWRRLMMDGQLSMYRAGAAVLGYDASGFLYDVIRKPQLRPLVATPEPARKYTKEGKLYAAQRDHDETVQEWRERLALAVGTAPNEYFARSEVVRLEGEIVSFEQDLWIEAQRLRDDVRLGRAPKNPDGCFRWNKECAFWTVCTGQAALDDQTKFVKLDDVHPELAEAADAA